MSEQTSAAYRLIREAMLTRKRIAFFYDDARREGCPLILGHTRGREVMLAYQAAGPVRGGKPTVGWRCFRLESMRAVTLTDGEWLEGASHQTTQTCVEDVDVEINIPETLR